MDLNIDEYAYEEDTAGEIDLHEDFIKVDYLTAAELRARNKEILLHRYYGYGSTMYKTTVKLKDAVEYIKAHEENFKVKIYLITQHYRDLADRIKDYIKSYNCEIWMVATEILDEFKGKIPFLNELFYKIEEDLLILHPMMKEFIAKRLLNEELNKCSLSLNILEEFNETILDNRELFLKSGSNLLSNTSIEDFVINIMDVYKLQKENSEEALNKTEEFFGARIKIDVLYDEDLVKELKDTDAYLAPVRELLESLPSHTLTANAVKKAIKELINFKTQE